MSLYEWAKERINPEITIWESHIITIIFSSLVAGIVAYLFFRKQEVLSEELRLSLEYQHAVNQQIQKEVAAKESLKSAESNQLQFLQILIDAIPAPVFYKDAQGIYTGCNHEFEAFLGKSREQIVGKNVYELSPSDLAQVYHEKDLELMRDRGKQCYESSVVYEDGTTHDVIFNKATYLTPDGDIGGLIGVILDITERKKLESSVAQSTLELKKANVIKDKFFSIIAHDLRGPMGSLTTLFNNVISSPKDFTEETLEAVRITTSNTGKFLEQLLTWARNQKGEISYNPQTIELGGVLAEIDNLFSAQAKSKGVSLNINLGDSCLVFADLDMLKTIFRNLISNALKFTRSGDSVSASVKDDDDHYIIRISDTGIGMNQETQQSLFRLDVKPQSFPGTQNEPGTGLGLILCSDFVAKNEGSIGVESEQGEGTTFWFTLPKG